jgi:hypothetical protein
MRNDRITSFPAMVAALRYKPGWSFRLEYGPTSSAACIEPDPYVPPTSGYLAVWPPPSWPPGGWPVMLVITVRTNDSGDWSREVVVCHQIAVPVDLLEYSHMPVYRWLLDAIREVEVHEMCEAFAIGDQRPFYPEHGPGANLYGIKDRGLEWPPESTGTG